MTNCKSNSWKPRNIEKGKISQRFCVLPWVQSSCSIFFQSNENALCFLHWDSSVLSRPVIFALIGWEEYTVAETSHIPFAWFAYRWNTFWYKSPSVIWILYLELVLHLYALYIHLCTSKLKESMGFVFSNLSKFIFVASLRLLWFWINNNNN